MKHTASNTKLLATIKRIFNAKIYKHALNIYNTEGEAATLAYLQQFVTGDVRQTLKVLQADAS
jgi:hypothetical protein